jgi:hypothetical protein
MIPHKTWNGLQALRLNNYVARVMPGSCASLGRLPTGKRESEGVCLMTVGTRLDADIRQPAIEPNGSLITRRKEWAFKRGEYMKRGTAQNVGGVLNGFKSDGTIGDGIYYGFICTTERPDMRGLVPESSVHLYLSKYFIGGGIGSAATGLGKNKRPKNIRYYRPHPACWMVHKGKLVPWLALGESHTVKMFYQFGDWQPYKSARIGGVKFHADGKKYYEAESAVLLKPGMLYGRDDGVAIEQWLSFTDVLPQTYKNMTLQIEYEGRGEIYNSCTKLRGQLVAIANGPGVAQFETMTGSDSTGRSIKLTLKGPAIVKRVYMLSCTSQQPM